MTPLVLILVHGAFQGGWVWDRVVPTIKAAGHIVYCPTLTGLEPKSAALTKDVGLDDHINDICKIIDEHRLSNVILVGHSYGGIVISGVAKARPNNISALLYVDAPIPENTQSLLDILGPEVAQIFYHIAQTTGDGWRVESFPAEAFGLQKESDKAWAFPQHTAQSLKSFTDKVTVLQTGEAPSIKIGYILCTPGNTFTQTQAQRAQEKGWHLYHIEALHSPMITDAALFSELLCNQILPELSVKST